MWVMRQGNPSLGRPVHGYVLAPAKQLQLAGISPSTMRRRDLETFLRAAVIRR